MDNPIISKHLKGKFAACQWVFAANVAVILVGGLTLRTTMIASGVSMKVFLFAASVAATASIVFLVRWFDFSKFVHRRPAVCNIALYAFVFVYVVNVPFDNLNTDWAFLLLAAGYSLAVYASRNLGVPGILLSTGACIPAILAAEACALIATTATLFISAAAAMLLACVDGWFGSRKRLLTIVTIALFAGLAAIVSYKLLSNHNIFNLLNTRLFPYTDPNGLGYPTVITREVLSSAKFLGMAENVRPESLGFLFGELCDERLLTQIAFRFGWGPMAIVLASFTLMLVSGFILSAKKRGLPRYISFTSMTVLFVQGILYAAQNIGFQLATVRAMPFLSGGFCQNIACLLLASLVLLFSKPIEVPHNPQYEDGNDCRADDISLVCYLRRAIKAWMHGKDCPKSDRHSKSTRDEGGTSYMEMKRFSLPDATDTVKSKMYVEDSLIALDEEDIDRLLSENSSCCLCTYTGSANDFPAQLELINIPGKCVAIQLICHSEITLDEVKQAVVAISDRCDPDANISFGLAIDEAMGMRDIRALVLSARI